MTESFEEFVRRSAAQSPNSPGSTIVARWDSLRKTERGNYVYKKENVILLRRSDAEEVLQSLRQLIHHYEWATVADLYELVGIESNFQDTKYGWKELKDVKIIDADGGYSLDLPNPVLVRW